MIKFQNVSKHYNEQIALADISFEIEKGQMAFLTGHSGAGKSTLLKLIMMMERPNLGEIWVNDLPLADLPNSKVPYHRRNIGFVHQSHHLLFDRTVFDNVALPLNIAGTPPDKIATRVDAALDKVGLSSKRNENPLALSGGEQQRVGIARAVVNRPAIIIADEPTGNLDPALSSEIMSLFESFNRVGVTVLVATHDLSLMATMAYPSITLRAGQLIGPLTPASKTINQ